MAHSVCPDDQAQRWEEGLYGTLCVCFALRATGGLPLDRSKGTPLTRAENLHGVRRFLP